MRGGVFLKTSAATPVKATGDADVVSENKVTFKKVLEVNKANVTVPNVTFDFSITGGTEVAVGELTNGGTVTGNPTITKPAFETTDTFTDNKISKDVTIDFSGVDFSKPGVYRYTITENKTGAGEGTNQKDNTVDGIANDTNNTRYLDVYVEQAVVEGVNTNKVAYCVMSTEEETLTSSEGKVTYDNKTDNFTNKYDVYDLTLEKKVEGSQGDRNKDFTFTVELTDITGANITVTKGETTITATETGKYTITLKNGESATLKNLPKGAKYTITESDNDGYTVSATANGDTDGFDANIKDVAKDTNGLTNDTTVTYTNTKDGLIPTGVLLTVGAPAVLGIAAVGGILTISIKNKKRNEED